MNCLSFTVKPFFQCVGVLFVKIKLQEKKEERKKPKKKNEKKLLRKKRTEIIKNMKCFISNEKKNPGK